MRKKYIIPCFVVLFTLLYAEDYHFYELNVAASFSIGSEVNQLGVLSSEEDLRGGGAPGGPGAISFIDGKLFIADGINHRIIECDENYRFLNTFTAPLDIEVPGQIIKVSNVFLYYNPKNAIVAFHDDGKPVFNYNKDNFNDPFFKNTKSKIDFLFCNDNYILLREDQTKTIYIYKNIQNRNDKIEAEISNMENFRINLEKGTVQVGDDIFLDEMNRFIVSDDLSTLDYTAFLNYWKEKQDKNSYTVPDTDITQDPRKFTRGFSLYYLGKDSDGNFYWSIGSGSVLVFNHNGYLIENLVVNDRMTKAIPAINYSGDVYFIGWDTRNVYLYNVPRNW